MGKYKTRILVAALLVLVWLLGSLIMSIAQAQTGPLPASPRSHGYTASVTIQNGWAHARKGGAGVSANDTVPDPNAMSWGDLPATAFDIREQWSTLSLAFYAYGDGTGDGDPNAGTCDVNVFFVTEYSSWEKIASFSIAIGELELDTYPVERTEINGGNLDPNESYKWAEGPFTDHSSGGYWPTTVNFSGTTNSIGRMNVSRLEAGHLVVFLDNKSGFTTVFPVVTGR